MTVLATTVDVEAVLARTLTDAEESFVLRLIEMQSARVVNELRHISWTPTTGTSVTITPHDGVLRLPVQPVTAITSVTVGSTLIESDDFTFKADGELIRTSPLALSPDSSFGLIPRHAWPLNGEFGWPPVPTTVVFNHGYATSSDYDDIVGLVAELVAGKLEGGALRSAGVMSESVATGTSSYSVTLTQGESGAWSDEHQRILDRYRRTKVTSVRLG